MKKYLFRIGYLLFLAYVPTMLMSLEATLRYDRETSGFAKSLVSALDSWFWLGEMWPLELRMLFPIPYAWPILLFLCWLVYSWIKRPSITKGILLFAASIFLSPVQSPVQRLIGWFEFGEPFFQPLYF